MDIKAVIFDVDGTILDTKEYIGAAVEHALSSHGHAVPEREFILKNVAGIPLTECYDIFAPDGDIISMCDAHSAFQEQRSHLIVAYDGLDDVLNELRTKKLKIGLCTSRGASTLFPSLKHLGLEERFDAVVHGDEITNYKPHPEPVFLALERLGVAREEAVMVGDTKADMGAGKAAKLAHVIGVTHGFGSRDELMAAGADRIINSLRELSALLG